MGDDWLPTDGCVTVSVLKETFARSNAYSYCRRIIESRTTLDQRVQREAGQRLVAIFNLLCQRLSGPLHDFTPTKGVISKCVDLLGMVILKSRHVSNPDLAVFLLHESNLPRLSC